LIAFGELVLSGYMCKEKFFELAEPIVGPSTDKVASMIKGSNTYVVFGMPELQTGSLYNSAPMIGPKGLVGVCRKLQPATFASPTAGVAFDEGVYFKPGEDIAVFDTEFGRIGIQICLDIWYPEIARAQALAGAWLIVHPSATAIRIKGEQVSPYTSVRARENIVYWCYINEVGEQTGREFMGATRVMDPTQGIVKIASTYSPAEGEKPAKGAEEEVVEYELESEAIYQLRRTYPNLRDVRPDVLDKLLKIARRLQHGD
jgi:predicted amidohydrolase